jgi:SAM-dependent methyltransferase
MNIIAHGTTEASVWVRRWSHLVPVHGTVLDVACGHGRHMKWFSGRGYTTTGVDRSSEAIDAARQLGEAILADIENAPWPLMQGDQPRTFDAVVVTNYLWRPLLHTIAQSVAPGGVLIYETFAAGNETVGKPSRPDFLLQPGELLRAFDTLRIVAFEEGFLDPPARFVQRLVAVRETAAPDLPPIGTPQPVPQPAPQPLSPPKRYRLAPPEPPPH